MMGNRHCSYCLSCYDDQEYVESPEVDSFPLPPINDGTEREDVLFEMSGLANSKLKPKSRIQPSVDYEYEETLRCNEPPNNILISNLPECKTKESISDDTQLALEHSSIAPSTIDAHESIHQHFSTTFEKFVSMSSESMGRETRTETCLMRRLGSSCERDDINDDQWI